MRSIQLALMLAGLAGIGVTGAGPSGTPAPAAVLQGVREVPPQAWLRSDPGDSLYRAAREALSAGQYGDAARLFRELRTRYPKSGYTPDALYWEAFSQYRIGGHSRLQSALELLRQQQREYPNAATTGDGQALATRINGELARQGDANAAAVVASTASELAPPAPPSIGPSPVGAAPAVAPVPPMGPGFNGMRGDGCDREDDVRLMALNAVLQMDADRAVPILQKVLARRDSGSACLRRKAVFILAQKDSPNTGDMLLNVVRTDPDQEVREQAVFWLSQVKGDAAVSALDSIARTSKDPELQKKALFALAQQNDSPKATAALRAFAERPDVSDETRKSAIFWLGQRADVGDVQFLRDLYGRSKSEEVKKQIIFAVSQQNRSAANSGWLVGIARNPNEDIELRKQALFWAGQGGATTAQVADLYSTMPDQQMKKQVIFVLAQQKDTAAITKLIDIAQHETDPELKKQALFWLGQSNDPRVTKVLEDVLTKP